MRRQWRHLREPMAFGFLVGVQFTLAAAAWTDLAIRPAADVRGSKRAWAWIIGINFVGPLTYFAYGRRPVNPAAMAAPAVPPEQN